MSETASQSGERTPLLRPSAMARFRSRYYAGWESGRTSPRPMCGSANNLCDTCWPKIFTAVLSAGLGGLLFGYDSSDIAIALPFIARSFKSVANSNWLKEAVVSMTTLGAAVGGFFGGFASDWYGRRSAMIGADVVFIIGALKAGSALYARQLIIARFIIGTAVGLTSICGPIYIAESAPKHLRAMMVVMYNIEVGIGTVGAFVGDFAFSHTKLSWRLMLGFAAVPALLQCLILAFFLPETPQWLAHYGRLEEAKEVCRTLNYDPSELESDEVELAEAYEKGKYLRTEEGQKDSWNVKSRPVMLQMGMGIALYLCCQVSAESAIVYYSIEIIQMAGFATESALMQAIFCLGVSSAFGVLSGFLAIDKLGRRTVLLFSAAGTSFSLLLLSFSFYIADVNSPPVDAGESTCSVGGGSLLPSTCHECLRAGCAFCSVPFVSGEPVAAGACLVHASGGFETLYAASCGDASSDSVNGTSFLYVSGCPSGYGGFTICVLCLFQFFFQSGVGLVPAAVNAEMYPNSVRGLCNGVTVAASWTCNFLVVGTFLSVSEWLTPAGAFAIYAVACMIFVIFFYFALPETSGLSLSEIQDMYQIYGTPGAPPARKLHAWALERRAEMEEQRQSHDEQEGHSGRGVGGKGSGLSSAKSAPALWTGSGGSGSGNGSTGGFGSGARGLGTHSRGQSKVYTGGILS